MTPLVGVLALQGDYAEHEYALASRGVTTRRIKRPADLVGIDGLVLPGGESTTMLKLLAIQELEQPLAAAIEQGLPTFATCAGVILLARSVVEPEQRSLGLLDLDVARNGYGRQIYSGTFDLEVESCRGFESPMRGVFIRAPRVLAAGPSCEVLARRDGDPVLFRQGAILGACFHPELEPQHQVVDSFVASVCAFAAEEQIDEHLARR